MEKAKFQKSMETIKTSFKFTDIHFSEKDDKNISRNKLNNSRTNESLQHNKTLGNSKDEIKIQVPKLNLNKIKEKRSMSSNLCSDNSDLIVKLDTKKQINNNRYIKNIDFF